MKETSETPLPYPLRIVGVLVVLVVAVTFPMLIVVAGATVAPQHIDLVTWGAAGLYPVLVIALRRWVNLGSTAVFFLVVPSFGALVLGGEMMGKLPTNHADPLLTEQTASDAQIEQKASRPSMLPETARRLGLQ